MTICCDFESCLLLLYHCLSFCYINTIPFSLPWVHASLGSLPTRGSREGAVPNPPSVIFQQKDRTSHPGFYDVLQHIKTIKWGTVPSGHQTWQWKIPYKSYNLHKWMLRSEWKKTIESIFHCSAAPKALCPWNLGPFPAAAPQSKASKAHQKA